MSPLKRSNNFAARMGRWSANHWKTAVFGWLAFVIAAFVIGNAVGIKYLDDTDANVGQARKGDKILAAGFPKAEDEQGDEQDDEQLTTTYVEHGSSLPTVLVAKGLAGVVELAVGDRRLGPQCLDRLAEQP